MTYAPTFWDRIADKYAADPVADMTSYEQTLARTASYLRQTDNVLEIGGGTGTTALKLAPHAGEITGTDFSAEMIRIAKQRALEAGVDNVRFQVAAAEDRWEPGSFDVVMAFNVLHLVADPAQVACEVRRSLKPGGLFISKTFCFEGRWRVLWPIARLMGAVGRWPSVTFFTSRWLEARIEAAGFEIVERADHPWPRRFIVARKV